MTKLGVLTLSFPDFTDISNRVIVKVISLLGHGFDPVIPVSISILVHRNMSETGYQFTRLRFYFDKYLI
jgi:hypothetical protein